MIPESPKCVFVIEDELPRGLQVNTAAVLALSLGRQFPDLVGEDLTDQAGRLHSGLTTIPMPILKASQAEIRRIAGAVASPGGDAEGPGNADTKDVFIVDVTDAAQQTTDYNAYRRRLEETAPEELRYLGIALLGPKRRINSLTGSLALLR
jgi:hypothetical protein